MTNKIDREDMLALTRRMNVARSSFTRIAGCYVDKDGDFDGSFNVNFLKLSAAEKKKNIEPVSYTHLDVYKRQEQSKSANGAACEKRRCKLESNLVHTYWS